jgi:hypothetical protein
MSRITGRTRKLMTFRLLSGRKIVARALGAQYRDASFSP